MKLKLLLGIVFFSLLSCSGDDSGVVNTNEPVTETPTDSVPPSENAVKMLKEIRRYFNGTLGEVLKFENDRLKERFLYNDNGQIFFEDYYTYDNSLLLTSRYVHNSEENVTFTSSMSYDDVGRLLSIHEESDLTNSYFVDITFDYSSPGYIVRNDIRLTNGQQGESQTIFDITVDGLVTKITQNNSDNMEAVYYGNNMISLTTLYYNDSGNDLITTHQFDHDMTVEVKGEYLNRNSNRFGNVKANSSLYSNDIIRVDTNYISKHIVSNEEFDYVYDYDANGYPITFSIFGNGNLLEREVITYQE